MNSIIFCEGRTDAVLVGQYLSRNKGWQYDSKGKKGLNIEKDDKTQIVDKYKLGEDWLYIWGVGGRTRFQNPLKKVLLLNKRADKLDSFEKIIILVDRDESEVDLDISNEFCGYLGQSALSNESWTDYSYTDGFGQAAILKALLMIIPFDEKGALESVMIHALNEGDDEAIIPQCCSFVEDLKTQKYLKKRRDRLKAKLSTIISIICPDRAVDSLVEIVEGVDWCGYSHVNETFKKLLEI